MRQPAEQTSASIAASRLRLVLIASFPVAFALHDLEEVLAADRWGRWAPERIGRRLPWLPAKLRRRTALTRSRMAIAVSVVAAAVFAGTRMAWSNRATDLEPMPTMLAAYTLHGGSHILISLALRSYTPGLATVPLVLVPYSWWAWRALGKVNLPLPKRRFRRAAAVGGIAAAGLAGAGHLLADALVGAENRTSVVSEQRHAFRSSEMGRGAMRDRVKFLAVLVFVWALPFVVVGIIWWVRRLRAVRGS